MSALPRFVTVRALGAGGEGRVTLVLDAQREGMVAVKRLHDASGESLLRMKSEFRAVSELRHPGLVRLYELGQDDEGLYFTMEAIDGETLDQHVWPTPRDADASAPTEKILTAVRGQAGAILPAEDCVPPVLDVVLTRFAPLLAQILEALAALHRRGLVHRDLKSSNVMVAKDGTVKLLDFGILAELGARGDVAGTPAFMAPEQLEGGAVSPATDLYAVGGLFYVMLAGRPPFVGSAATVVRDHLYTKPVPLDVLVPEVPPPFARAAALLLSKRAADRPTLAWLDEHLLAPLGWPRLSPETRAAARLEAPLIGRAELSEELAARLERALGGGFGALVLRGRSGIGKTRLVEWLADEARAHGAAVLRGRARPRERIPYNALDGAIDGLARGSSRVRADSSESALRAVAAAAFPVFGWPDAPLERPPTRSDVFAAIAALLTRAASVGDVVLAIDDLQWADDDSLALFESLVRATPAGVLIVGTLQDEPEHAAVGSRLAAIAGLEIVDVPPLSDAALAQLVRNAARERGSSLDTAKVTRLVAQCDGRAMLAEVMGRGAGAAEGEAPGDRPLDALLDSLGPAPQAILSALVVADEIVPVELLARVVGQTIGEIEDHLVTLGADGLVRSQRRDGEAVVDLYHDVVRAALSGRLTEPRRRATHAAFLARLLPDARTAPERLVRHLLGADRLAEAGTLALDAAERARARFAYGLAAEMYEVARRAGVGETKAILHAIATCLEAGARYHLAAERWRELAALVDESERGDIALHEAACLLGASDVVNGYARLDEAMRQTGAARLHALGPGALVDGLRFLIGPRFARRPLPDKELDLATTSRVARDVKLATLASYFDPLSGVRSLMRARKAADELGAWEEGAFCDFQLAFMAYYANAKRGPVRLAERYRASAVTRIGGRRGARYETRALPFALDAMHLIHLGRFEESGRAFDEALAIADAAGATGRTEALYMRAMRWAVEFAQQRVGGMLAQHRRLVAASHEGSGGTVRVQLHVFASMRAFFVGDRDEMQRTIDALSESWPREPMTAQRCLIDITQCLSDMGRIAPDELRRRLEQLLRDDKRFGMLASIDSGVYWSIVALIFARAHLAGDPEVSRRRVERATAKAMAAPPMGATRALRACAYVAEKAGDPERAILLLLDAEREAQTWGQMIDVAVARHHRGKRLGGDEGTELRASARELLAEAGAPRHWLDEDAV